MRRRISHCMLRLALGAALASCAAEVDSLSDELEDAQTADGLLDAPVKPDEVIELGKLERPLRLGGASAQHAALFEQPPVRREASRVCDPVHGAAVRERERVEPPPTLLGAGADASRSDDAGLSPHDGSESEADRLARCRPVTALLPDLRLQ